MITRKSESAVRPVEWDIESSKNKIYHRYDIEYIEATEDNPPMYRYTEDVYTNKEYIMLIQRKQDEGIEDINGALIELAGIIGG